MKTKLQDIEDKCQTYRDARSKLDETLAELAKALDQVKADFRPALRRLINVVSKRESELYLAVQDAPECFEKRRTATFHDVKVGFVTTKGKVRWEQEAAVINLIRKKLPDMEDTLVCVAESVSREAVRNLTADQMRRIGCWIDGATEAVVLKDLGGDVDKAINKLISSRVAAITEPETEPQAA